MTAVPPTTSRIVLVEDHVLLGEVLRRHFAEIGIALILYPVDNHLPDALTGADADLVLLDYDLGVDGLRGEDLVAPLVERGICVVMFTGTNDRAALGRCLRAGAHGVISKTESYDVLVRQVEAALRNDPVLPIEAERIALLHEARKAATELDARTAVFDSLTNRERDVLWRLVCGESVTEIATGCHVAVSTVRSQVKSMRRKLGARTQIDAVRMALESEWFGQEVLAERAG